jgi:signal transduction histidine kinase
MFSTGSITRKVMTVILVTCGAVLILACGTFVIYERLTHRQAAVRELSTLARVIAANSTAALAFQNPVDATQVLSAVAADPDVVAAAVYDRSGALFAMHQSDQHSGTFPERPGEDGYRFGAANVVLYEPVAIDGRRLGTLYLESSLGDMRAQSALYGALVAGVMLLSGVVALAISFRLQRHVSRPIAALAQTALAISERGDYSVRAAKVSNDELGQLTDAFNSMLARVDEQNRTLLEQGTSLRREVEERGRAEATVRALNTDLEQRVVERTNALQVANKELESFSYSVSHDLRAPIRHVLGYVEMLEEETANQLSEDAKRYLETIRTSSLEMNQLVEDLLGFARMGRTEMQEGEIDLGEVIEETIHRLESMTRDRSIVWQIMPLPAVIGDQSLIKQVFTNLLGNAVKYSRLREHAQITVGVSGEEHGRVVLFVRDNGAGFDMRYADKLFGVFQRLHRADQFEGTGIGLATVQRIIARHGGRIWADAAVDQGATFSFTLKPSDPAILNQVEHAIAS